MAYLKETRTISARIPEDVHAEILDRCNREGCTVNHFLNRAIEFILTGYTEFDFGDPADKGEKEPPVPTPAKRVVITVPSTEDDEE